MTSRSDSARNRNWIGGEGHERSSTRNLAASIDVAGSNAITFGYVNELARPGRVIGGAYRLLAPLRGTRGRGGAAGGSYGSCYWRADSLRFGQPVAIEMLDPAIGEDASLADLFAAEARAASGVSSPFITRVLGYGVEQVTPYLVTELPPLAAGSGAVDLGETLASRVAAGRSPAFADFVRLFHELCQGVQAMHARGLLHRDLRSERVALLRTPLASGGEREVPKLSFGISKLMNDTLELVRTMARRAVAPAAAPTYMSPEQVLGTAPLGPACDVWSLAVIAFEAMTGELPFVGATLGERLVQICAGPARVPSALQPALPAGFDAWFARGVEKAPEDRWPSVHAMAEALRRLRP